VDHGKSTLIQALTGIDPDRLEEEKTRGMTIDLGFAWLTLPSGQEVSIVDVPGHERFIKNMLAGVGGIDIALLVVAADEGVMPQTREHLAILDLLAVSTGVVAITKRDLVDSDWLDLVLAETAEVLAPTSLRGAPLLPVSSASGEGLTELAVELDRQLAHERQRRQTGWPRLPVDRVFTMPGFGTVVTGTLVDGTLHVGQEIELQPSGRRARIRGLQSHRSQIDQAPAGTRVAANLVGLSVEDVDRGEVLTSPGWLAPTRAVDAQVRIVADSPRPLVHNAQVSFHSGSAEALGRVTLLDAQELPAGETGWAHLRLDRPLALTRGDPFIIRLPAANLTIGGGTVVEEHARRHRRFQERVLTQLAVLERGSPGEQALQALQAKEPTELRQLAARLGQPPDEIRPVLNELLTKGEVVALPPARGDAENDALAPTSLLISAAGWKHLTSLASETARAHHEQHPLRRGVPREELRARLTLDGPAYARVERRLLADDTLCEDGPFLRRPDHEPRLTEADERRAAALLFELRAAGVAPPARGDLRARHQVSDDLIQHLIHRGDLEEVSPDLLYAREAWNSVSTQIVDLLRQQGHITVAEVRDLSGTSRKYALALLEHLDAQNITRRVGDERVLLR
jgi:selenocysteine-specific elongation factor